MENGMNTQLLRLQELSIHFQWVVAQCPMGSTAHLERVRVFWHEGRKIVHGVAWKLNVEGAIDYQIRRFSSIIGHSKNKGK
jgi:hypothetical protein